jgi:hypothetical protein
MTSLDNAKPNGCFVQFLKYDAQFVNEIGGAFRASRFTVVRGWCRSSPQNLSSNVFPRRGARQASGELYDPHRELY